MCCSRPRVRAAIDKMFVEGISPRRWRKLRDHLHACESCRSYYDRLMHFERHLDGGGALSSSQLAAVGAALALEQESPPETFPKLARRLLPYALVSGLAAFVLGAPGLLHSVRTTDEQFQSRGAGEGSGVGVRAVCVDDTGDKARVRAVFPRGAGGGAACHASDILHLTYSNAVNPGEAFEYLFVFAVDQTGEPHWYYPEPAEGQSLAIERGADVVDRPLPGGVAFGRSHSPGKLRVVALFSHQPVSISTVESRLVSVATTGDLAAMPPLGVEGAKEVSFILELED